MRVNIHTDTSEGQYCHMCDKQIADGHAMLVLNESDVPHGEIPDQWLACSVGCMMDLMNKEDLTL